MNEVETTFTNKIYFIYLLIISLVLISCGSSNEEIADESESNSSGEFPEFSNFPNQLFLGIEMEMTIEEAHNILTENNFEIKYQEDSRYYERDEDSIEVIIGEYDAIYDMTVFVKNKHYLSKKDELLEFLSQNATKTVKNQDFSVIEFDKMETPIKLKYFVQDEFIRLVFLLN